MGIALCQMTSSSGLRAGVMPSVVIAVSAGRDADSTSFQTEPNLPGLLGFVRDSPWAVSGTGDIPKSWLISKSSNILTRMPAFERRMNLLSVGQSGAVLAPPSPGQGQNPVAARLCSRNSALILTQEGYFSPKD